MALKVKAVERLLKFDKESAGKYRYVMKPEIYSSLTQAKVITAAATALTTTSCMGHGPIPM
jgi:hypothetical protein